MLKKRANRKTALVPLLLCLTIFCASLLLAGCLARSDDAASKDSAASHTQKSLSPDEKAAAIVQKMSDAEKVGQLLMIGIQGCLLITSTHSSTAY